MERKLGIFSGEKVYSLVALLTVDEVTNLFTVGITILVARPNLVYIPESAMFVRTGAKYLTAPGNINIKYDTVSAAVLAMDKSALTDTNGNAFWMTNQHTAAGASDIATSVGGKALIVSAATGNPTVDADSPGSPVSIHLLTRIMPNKYELIGQEYRLE